MQGCEIVIYPLAWSMKLESLLIAGQPYGNEFIPEPSMRRPPHFQS